MDTIEIQETVQAPPELEEIFKDAIAYYDPKNPQRFLLSKTGARHGYKNPERKILRSYPDKNKEAWHLWYITGGKIKHEMNFSDPNKTVETDTLE